MDGKNDNSGIMAKVEQELLQKFRIIHLSKFKDKENFDVYIHLPNVEEQTLISDYYSQIFNNLLIDPNNKLLTEKRMVEVLKEKGIWTKRDDEEMESLRKQLTNLEIDILEYKRHNNNKEVIEKFEEDYNNLRNKVIDKAMQKEGFLSHTIDKKAESKSRMYQIVLCVKDSDGNQLWKTIDELGKENSTAGVAEIIAESQLFYSGLSKEVLQWLPKRLFEQDDTSGAIPLEELQENQDGKEPTV